MEMLKLMIKALENDFDAMHKIADIFFDEGKYKYGESWLKLACEKNDDVAMYRLGVMYTSDESNPLYNLAQGNALLANSASLGNNTARLYFAKHIIKNAPERLYERAVKLLLDAYDDDVDEALVILDDFMQSLYEKGKQQVWQSTISFEVMQKAAEKKSKYALLLCGLAGINNKEYIVFEGSCGTFEDGIKYIEESARQYVPFAAFIYCKITMIDAKKFKKGMSESSLRIFEKKWELMYELRDIVLKNYNYEGEYIGFYLKYTMLLSELCERAQEKGDNEEVLRYAELVKKVYTTCDGVFEKDFTDGMYYFNAVMLTNGVNLDEYQASLFRKILQKEEAHSQEYTDKLIICYVSYMVLVNELANSDELLEAKRFLLRYSEKENDEYKELMGYLEQRLS